MCVSVCLWQLELPFWFANFSIFHFPFESTKSTKCNAASASFVSFRSCILIIYFGKLLISLLSICRRPTLPQPSHLNSLSFHTIRHSPTLSTYCLAINADLYYFPLLLSLSHCTLLLCFVTQLLHLIFEKNFYPFPSHSACRKGRAQLCMYLGNACVAFLADPLRFVCVCTSVCTYVLIYVCTYIHPSDKTDCLKFYLCWHLRRIAAFWNHSSNSH